MFDRKQAEEMAHRIADVLDDEAKREFVLMQKIKGMHDDGSISTHDLKMTLALFLSSTFPTMVHSDIPGKPKDITGLAVDTTDASMMAGFLGGILAVLDMEGMPSFVTDMDFCHMLSHSLVAVKVRDLSEKTKEERSQ